jgi:hypothetical protein
MASTLTVQVLQGSQLAGAICKSPDLTTHDRDRESFKS